MSFTVQRADLSDICVGLTSMIITEDKSMTGWPSQGVKQKQIKNFRVFWSINFPHDIFQDWSILSCITNVYADLINSGIVHALFFFPLLLKLEQIPDSQMFV